MSNWSETYIKKQRFVIFAYRTASVTAAGELTGYTNDENESPAE